MRGFAQTYKAYSRSASLCELIATIEVVMKRLFPLIILLSTFGCPGQSFKDKIATFDKAKSYTVQYDKFKDITTVTSPQHLTKSSSKWISPGISVYVVIEF